MIYSGINATQQLTQAYDDGAERERLRQDDGARKRAGGMLSGGDLTGASRELFSVGDLAGGMELRGTAKTELEDKNTRSVLSELYGSMGTDAQKSGGGNLGNNSASGALARPNYGGGAVQSEAMPEMGAEPTQGKASGALSGAGGAPPGMSSIEMAKYTDGQVDSKTLYSVASKLAANGNMNKANEFYTEAIKRQQLETDIDWDNKGKVAQMVFDQYMGRDRAGRKAFAEEVKGRPDLLASAPSDVLKMLNDDRDDNDDEAMMLWAQAMGADPKSLTEERKTAADEKARREQEIWNDSQDLKLYKDKAVIDASYEEGGENYTGEGSGEDGGDPAYIEPDDYGAGRIGKLGKDGTLWAPELANEPAGVKQIAMRNETSQYNDMVMRVNADGGKTDVLMRYVQKLDDKDLWEALGSNNTTKYSRGLGIAGDKTAIAELGGLTEELVSFQRSATKGIFTDDDAARAARMSANIDFSGETIRSMMMASIDKSVRGEEEKRFKFNYIERIKGRGSLREADYIWDQYEQDNPFLRLTEDNKIVENDEMEEFSDWYENYRYSRMTPEQLDKMQADTEAAAEATR